MAGRRLSPDEKALWTAVARSVRPIRPGTLLPEPPEFPEPAAPVKPPKRLIVPPAITVAPPARAPVAVLDGNWEKRIRGGTLTPDMTIDLHGHSLAAAHVRLNRSIALALATDARVLLVVTGNPPKSDARAPDVRRGAIRAEIGHWLRSSPHAAQIASVRVAHRRHGGQGAIYIILRRKK